MHGKWMVYMQMQIYENPENNIRELTNQTCNGKVKESVKEREQIKKKTGAMNTNHCLLLSTFLCLLWDIERNKKINGNYKTKGACFPPE